MSADFGRVLIKDGELLAVAPAAEIGVLYVIPNTVTKISASFAGCKKLEIVRIPNSVIKINQYAFAGCDGITQIILPDTLEDFSFLKNCSNLESITIPKGVKKIVDTAFYGCFRSFRPDSLSVFRGEDTVPPQELRIDRKSQRQSAAKRARCSILSASCTTFAVWMPKKM